MALQDLEADEELFSVDRKDILTAENTSLTAHEDGKRLLENIEDTWLQLIMAMIWEFLQGENSRWKPYFDILPSSFDTLMFWTEEELEHLQASAVRHKVGKTGANQTLSENIVAPILQHRDTLFSGLVSNLGESDLLTLAHRMGSSIMAYAFDLEKDPSQQHHDEEGYVSDDEDELLPKGMVPMADMLNADADRNNAHLYYSESKVTMRALGPIKAGEEIFNDYGPLPRADLLRRYGYVTPNYAQYDVAEIPSSVVIEHFRDPKGHHDADSMDIDGQNNDFVEQKLDWLKEHDMYDDGFDIAQPLEADALFPKELQLLIQTLVLSEQDFGSASKKEPKLRRPVPSATLQHYHSILQTRLGQYATTIQEDRALIESPEQDLRKSMAIQVRLGEKELLGYAIEKVKILVDQSHKAIQIDKKRPAPDTQSQHKKQKR